MHKIYYTNSALFLRHTHTHTVLQDFPYFGRRFFVFLYDTSTQSLTLSNYLRQTLLKSNKCIQYFENAKLYNLTYISLMQEIQTKVSNCVETLPARFPIGKESVISGGRKEMMYNIAHAFHSNRSTIFCSYHSTQACLLWITAKTCT